MNSRKKMKALLMLIAGTMIMLFVIIYVINDDNKSDELDSIETVEKNYDYDFGTTIDLEKDGGVEEYVANGTDYPSFGVVDDFYDETDIKYYDDKMQIETYDGNMIISLSWMDEGNALLIDEPDFGILKKFVLRNNLNVSIVYVDVTMKDVESYIEKITNRGFDSVIKNEKDKKNDTYSYYAKNADEVKFTMNYDGGELYIEIYKK